ncbi:MAG: FAD-dependent oxidoreductase [Magnetococcales bacterium]|nr:FAD-dependent oxidoreductase [Magnetococcales bacterium]
MPPSAERILPAEKARSSQHFPAFDVLILGAGVAGLAAGVALVEAGRKPLILEAAPTSGGRARSFYDPTFGETLDNGPHLLVGAYHHTLAYLDKLGTRAKLHRSEGVSVSYWTREQGFHQLSCPNLPAPIHLFAGLTRFGPLPKRDLLAALRIGPALWGDPNRWEAISVSQWLSRHGQTSETLNHWLWYPLCLATLNEPPETANAALFARVLKDLFYGSRHHAQTLIPTAPLSEILIDPAVRFISQRGGHVINRCRVKGVVSEGQGIDQVLTQRGVIATRGSVPIISTLPPHALSRLLPQWAAHSGWQGLQTAPIVSLHLRYPEPVSLPAPLVGLPFMQSQWLFSGSGVDGASMSQGVSVVMSGAYEEARWSSARLSRMVQGEIAQVLPELAGVPAQKLRVIKEHRATFAARPGTTPLRPGIVTPWKNLWIAGDWTDTGLPATLEGSVASATLAAKKTFNALATGAKIV